MTNTDAHHEKEDEDEDEGSPYERCGFVVHFLSLLFGGIYVVSFIVAVGDGSISDGNNNSNSNSNSKLSNTLRSLLLPEWVHVVVPPTLLALFVATPIVYGALNSLSSPRMDSIDTVQDEFTRRRRMSASSGTQQGISDIGGDIAGEFIGHGQGDSSSVAAIYDLDVAVINDLIYNENKFFKVARSRDL